MEEHRGAAVAREEEARDRRTEEHPRRIGRVVEGVRTAELAPRRHDALQREADGRDRRERRTGDEHRHAHQREGRHEHEARDHRAADRREDSHDEQVPVAIAEAPGPRRHHEHAGGEEGGDEDRAVGGDVLRGDQVERHEEDDRRLEVAIRERGEARGLRAPEDAEGRGTGLTGSSVSGSSVGCSAPCASEEAVPFGAPSSARRTTATATHARPPATTKAVPVPDDPNDVGREERGRPRTRGRARSRRGSSRAPCCSCRSARAAPSRPRPRRRRRTRRRRSARR